MTSFGAARTHADDAIAHQTLDCCRYLDLRSAPKITNQLPWTPTLNSPTWDEYGLARRSWQPPCTKEDLVLFQRPSDHTRGSLDESTDSPAFAHVHMHTRSRTSHSEQFFNRLLGARRIEVFNALLGASRGATAFQTILQRHSSACLKRAFRSPSEAPCLARRLRYSLSHSQDSARPTPPDVTARALRTSSSLPPPKEHPP